MYMHMYMYMYTGQLHVHLINVYLICFPTPKVLGDELSGTYLPSAKYTKLSPQ